MILLKNVLWCQLQFISLNLGLYMCQGEFVIGDKCVVGHFWLINFWFIHRTDAICLPLTHAREARITTRPCGGVQVVTWAGRVHIKINQLHISRHYTLIISFLCLFNSPPGLIYCGGSYSYFIQLFFNQRLCQWRPNSGTNKPIWPKYCRHSLQPIDRIFAKFGPDRSIGSRVRASLA